MEKTLDFTKIVRKVIRKHEKHVVWLYTNKYKHCRTVKVANKLSAAARQELVYSLTQAGCEDHSVYEISNRTVAWHGRRVSTIIRIPNQ